MARCGCGSSCSCLIVAGDGAQVDGIGTVENPYVITSDASQLLDQLEFIDTSTVDFEATGLGTRGSPMLVSAVATVAMTDLIDVLGAPGLGQVPVWVGDHWEFQNQSGGGGSVSGLWGSPPLDIYGADPLVGQETYIDSNGQIRSAPSVFDFADNGFTATTPYDSFPQGLSVLSFNSAGNTTWPVTGVPGQVNTTRRSTYAVQHFFEQKSTALTDQAFYFRVWSGGTSGAWGPWVPVAGQGNPFAVASGVSTVSASVAANTGVSLPIAYPTGRFTVPPIVVASADSNGYGFASAAGSTTGGCTLRYYNPTASVHTNCKVHWTAVQMTPTSAAG